VGSAVLTGSDGLDIKIIDSLVREMSDLVRQGYSIVTGDLPAAIVSGKQRMNITGKLKSMPRKTSRSSDRTGKIDAGLFQIF